MFNLQYLLDYDPFSKKSDVGVEVPRSEFNVKKATGMFHKYVREYENLLKANLVWIFFFE